MISPTESGHPWQSTSTHDLLALIPGPPEVPGDAYLVVIHPSVNLPSPRFFFFFPCKYEESHQDHETILLCFSLHILLR